MKDPVASHVGTPPAPEEGSRDDRELTPAARRALDEAAARRAERDAAAGAAPAERGGRGGLDPVRYADWEIGGRAVDF
jgi:hypothetical protein